MAETKQQQPAANAVQTKPVEVSQELQNGEKFIKWDEVDNETVLSRKTLIAKCKCNQTTRLIYYFVPQFATTFTK